MVETVLKLKNYIKDLSYNALIIQKYKNTVFDFVQHINPPVSYVHGGL